ncbi:ribosomal protein S18 acetylase RimI-like enzyme [Nitrobacteraceae bacterium AZCC 2161]
MTAAPTDWRAMTAADLPAVKALADCIHPDYPEDEAVFTDRLALHPAGCFTLQHNQGIAGYVISHPWHFRKPPALNALLAQAASPASTFYIHDLALLPAARKSGAASRIVDILAAHARSLQLPNMTLVAVNNSVHFWQRQGFNSVVDAGLDRQLQSYDEHARFMSRDLP